MGLISVNGVNPFESQPDPYISMESSIDYSNNPEGEIINSYTLEGVLTGCDKQDLNRLRDGLVTSFDWKAKPSITENIQIHGVISANDTHQIIPSSLDFESSNYIGALKYTLKLEIFTGINQDQDEEDNQLINKTHTETTTVDEKGCISVSTNIGCSPNQNLTGCKSIEKANEWIKKQLGQTKLGAITRQFDLPLQNESLTVNPLTSEVQYSSSHAHDCENTANAGAQQGGLKGVHVALCSETTNETPECPNSIEVTQYNGEVYKSGADASALSSILQSEVLGNYESVQNLSTNYSTSQESITFSFATRTQNGQPVFEPVDYILNDYSITEDQNHDDGTRSVSVNGSYSLLNPKDLDSTVINSIPNSQIQATATSFSRGLKLKSKNISRSPQDGTISYGFSFGSDPNENDDTDENGLNSYSVSVSLPVQQYDIIQVLNCEDYIMDKGYSSKGNISISVTAVSGSGYNYEEIAAEKMKELKASHGRSDMIITAESDNFSNNKRSLTKNLTATFTGDSAVDKATINYI